MKSFETATGWACSRLKEKQGQSSWRQVNANLEPLDSPGGSGEPGEGPGHPPRKWGSSLDIAEVPQA